MLVLRSPQTGHHGIIGVAVDDIAGGGDDVWEQVISELKQRSLLDTGNCAKENSAVERSRVSNLEMRLERHAMRSVLGALGYLAHQSWPDLSGPVSILQGSINRAQKCATSKEKNRRVRLAKAHKDLALPVSTIPVGQICFVSDGRRQWWKYTGRGSPSGVCGVDGRAGLAVPQPWFPGDLTVSSVL